MDEKPQWLVRQITLQDDFTLLHQMMNDTAKRFNPDPTFQGLSTTTDELKEEFSNVSLKNGFLAEQNGQIIGFMGVSLSPITKNGNIIFGCIEGYEDVLTKLIEVSIEVVRKNGGEKLYKFTFSKFGQIRNSEISLWEKFGFLSEEYSNVQILLHLDDWMEPEHFNNVNITLPSRDEYEAIKKLLIDDGESFISERMDDPASVLLTLRDEHTNEIMGLAYYHVDVEPKSSSQQENLSAYAFTLYFRPVFQWSKSEMQRLLHAALLSTKQLGVSHVITRITLKDFNIFALMIREGFDDFGIENMSTIHLYKKV
ncbi:hypothetical protein FHS15_004675 [Paenibacillus castaneae]|uniref:hypothetical protein n=2 Tax=Paenibacillus TaxID=44249 RepID=UPI000C9B2AD0|nr:hypothetical protein [Paenibacillus castaneae]NIK79514.1 hypothetical protein [Paenibacillus castaneae]